MPRGRGFDDALLELPYTGESCPPPLRRIVGLVLPRLLDTFLVDGRPCLVMEDGGRSLKGMRLNTFALRSAIRQLAAGYAFCHERGILHLDIKPPNMLVDWAGRFRVADFSNAVLKAGRFSPERKAAEFEEVTEEGCMDGQRALRAGLRHPRTCLRRVCSDPAWTERASTADL